MFLFLLNHILHVKQQLELIAAGLEQKRTAEQMGRKDIILSMW